MKHVVLTVSHIPGRDPVYTFNEKPSGFPSRGSVTSVGMDGKLSQGSAFALAEILTGLRGAELEGASIEVRDRDEWWVEEAWDF